VNAKTKTQLLRAIRKETKPPKGFGQWVLVLEHRRLSEHLGLLHAEALLDGNLEWSGSISVNLPEHRKLGPDGKTMPSEWENLPPGQRRYNVFTFEMRGKSVVELAKGFLKRSFEDGKIQDLLPWGKN
jgi:hypothetical protein